MKILLSNPAGLWALCAIPLVLLIHFLQEKSRRVRVSTLFLLERVQPQSVGGARIERLRNSVPLWLQLLAALIITWLLCEPRWIREDSRQTVAVVLDSSVSMSAFKNETRPLLGKKLLRWSRAAAHTDWHLLESAGGKAALYAGSDLDALLAAFEKWEPSAGTHAPDDALLTARGLLRNGVGVIIFVTDHKADVSSDVAVLSAGDPIENVGFAGGEAKLIERANGTHWRALVKNYGRERQEREWWIEPEGAATKTEVQRTRLVIEPGQTLTLEGEFPPDMERATLVLSGDRFTWDDRLPLQKPKLRNVRLALKLDGASGDIFKKMTAALDGVEPGSLIPDLVINELGTAAETDAVQTAASDASDAGTIDPTWVAAEDHRLTRDLAWSGLLCGRPLQLSLSEGDEPLLWKGDRPLALLRHTKLADGRTIRRLILNWNVAQSNAPRVPALLVMLQRFMEMTREEKREPWAGNFELAQKIDLPRDVTAKLRVGSSESAFDGRAPGRPGFFDVTAHKKTLLSGAVHFADTREADFREAVHVDTTEDRRMESAMKQTEADPWTPGWLLALAGCFAGSWAWRARKPRVSSASDVTLRTATAR